MLVVVRGSSARGVTGGGPCGDWGSAGCVESLGPREAEAEADGVVPSDSEAVPRDSSASKSSP